MSRSRIRVDGLDPDDLDDLDLDQPDLLRARRRPPSARLGPNPPPVLPPDDVGPDDPDPARAQAFDPDLGGTLSTYPGAEHGPAPAPPWVVTSGNARDHERGVLKTGKEAEVHLVERLDADTGAGCLLAAKRYRDAQHRLFHRDAGYLEGRRTRRSRDTRAVATRTAYGKSLIADQWAATEFAMLGRLWVGGVAVPYPVQRLGTELLVEFIGDQQTGVAAPRLAEIDRHGATASELWERCVDAVLALGALGYTHGDLSPYNVLVDDGRVVLIDLPQVVDLVANPQADQFLERDCRNLAQWFDGQGVIDADADRLARLVRQAAGLA